MASPGCLCSWRHYLRNRFLLSLLFWLLLAVDGGPPPPRTPPRARPLRMRGRATGPRPGTGQPLYRRPAEPPAAPPADPATYQLPETLPPTRTLPTVLGHNNPHYARRDPVSNVLVDDSHPHGRLNDPERAVSPNPPYGRFLIASVDYGRTFNRIRNVLNMLEAAILLNRTAVMPVAVPGAEQGEAAFRFDDGLAHHVPVVTQSSFLTNVAPLLKPSDIAATREGAMFGAQLKMPTRLAARVPQLRPQQAVVDAFKSVRHPLLVVGPIQSPPSVDCAGGEWVALPHLHFDRAIERMGRAIMRHLKLSPPFLAIHLRALENECSSRARKFGRPYEWCDPPLEKLTDQVGRVRQRLREESPGGDVQVFVASDKQRPDLDDMLRQKFGTLTVPGEFVPANELTALLVDVYIATQADAFIGSAFSSVSGFIRAFRVYNSRFPRNSNYPYTNRT